jgi:hypothetical protein
MGKRAANKPERAWDRPDVPHKGWRLIAVHDNGDATHTCEMCGNEEVRYVHVMEHDRHEELSVGCVCAEKMSQDYTTPGELQTRLADNARKRLALVHSPQWSGTWSGNQKVRRNGRTHVVFFKFGKYKYLSYDSLGRKVFSPGYATIGAAVEALAEHLYPSRVRRGRG